jgi:putative addiction module component (TIGR02574 family)
MSRTFEEVRDEAMTLTVEERGWLAEQLWDSARTAEEREIDQAWVAEAERRLAETEAGVGELIPGDQVIREVRTPR